MEDFKYKSGSSTSYRQDKNYSGGNQTDSKLSIECAGDSLYTIRITANDKEQILKDLSETDITTLCNQILNSNACEEWRCKCDSGYALDKYMKDYYKKHGTFPCISG